MACNKIDREWVLDYLPSGKGVIPYEMIQRCDSLDISPEKGSFFLPHHFYSSLKDSAIDDKDYEAVKKFYQTLNLGNLGQLNKLHYFQDTVILGKIFEQRSNRLQELFKFNPRKCNSTRSLSGCVHRDKSKCLIALPTNASHILCFERTVIGDFGFVNTRLAFDSQILLPKNDKDKYKLLYNIEGQKKEYRQKY